MKVSKVSVFPSFLRLCVLSLKQRIAGQTGAGKSYSMVGYGANKDGLLYHGSKVFQRKPFIFLSGNL